VELKVKYKDGEYEKGLFNFIEKMSWIMIIGLSLIWGKN
jgi:hypothetical protein